MRSWCAAAAATSLQVMAVTMISQQGKGQTLCDVFDADGISGNTDATADYNGVDEFDFACAENEFLQGFDVNRRNKLGQIQSLRFSCTDGEVSNWLNNTDDAGIDSETFDVGISSIESEEVEVLGFFNMGMLFVTGYDLTLANGLIEERRGPYGTEAGNNYTWIPMYTNCQSAGLEAFATGATVWASENNVYGVRLACANVTATCYPPSYPDPPTPELADVSTPAPAVAISGISGEDSRWFDAAWEVAVTVIGAAVTGAAAVVLRSCYSGTSSSCQLPTHNETPTEQ